MGTIRIRTRINGRTVEAEVAASTTLLDFLRDELDLKGTKRGCGHGDCGSCTVLMDGKPVLSCITFAFQAHEREIMTIEGLSADGGLDLLEDCFMEAGAIQCGFCTPAMILVAKSLLDENPRPTRQEIREAISGVLCRCTGYRSIVNAVEGAAARMEGG
jgi:carbon-monoxide dehydrogenase small subunit